MRDTHTAQMSLFENYSKHKLGVELKAISKTLDDNLDLLIPIQRDLVSGETKPLGRKGLSAESVLRCMILKQRLKISYEALAFHLSDSETMSSFARIGGHVNPKKSCLQACIRKIKAPTLEFVNQQILLRASSNNQLSFDELRIDSTVVLSNIVQPSDSQLLNDSIRVISRLLMKSNHLTGVKINFNDHRDAAKSLAFRIFNAKKKEKYALYPELLGLMSEALEDAENAKNIVKLQSSTSKSQAWLDKMEHFCGLANKVVWQTTERVVHNKTVPSSKKIVSIFEEHTDIIIKGKRDVLFGHKINLSTEENGFITHLSIENGNPCDSQLHSPVIDYHQQVFFETPKTIVSDGCYASKKNVLDAKASGVKRVVFSKPVGLSLQDMGVKEKSFKKLKKFRAGVEANISEFKRAYGAGKATWKKHDGFTAYVWASVISYNLFKLSRI